MNVSVSAGADAEPNVTLQGPKGRVGVGVAVGVAVAVGVGVGVRVGVGVGEPVGVYCTQPLRATFTAARISSTVIVPS